MKKGALLHSSSSHLKRFQPLLKPYENDFIFEQYVNKTFLDDIAINGVLTSEITVNFIKFIGSTIFQNVDTLLITCSTLGIIADYHPIINETKLIRIDNSLSEEAVKHGGKIAVIYTVETTREATSSLFEGHIEKNPTANASFDMIYVPNAWDFFSNR